MAMTDQDEIRGLLATYALTLDTDDIDGCLALFAEDAEFVVFGNTLFGPDQIRNMLSRAPRGIHLTGATLVNVDGDSATVRSQVLFVDSTTHELRPAIYDDKVIRINGKWRFMRRQCRFVTTTGLSPEPKEAVQ
jgi:uncharacterized protein (TIGR02246 family)